MECLGLEQIEEFASEGVDASRRRQIEDHVSSCADCRQLLVEVRENLRVARRVAAPGSGAHDTAIASGGSPRPGRAGIPRRAPSNPDTALPPDSFPGYQIVREVSRGGQGVVYLAIQHSTRRRVAIKVLRDRHFADAAERARFEREVQILGQLQHSNIVSIYDSGSVGGNAFYVMDYISGKPLDEYVREQGAGNRETAGSPQSKIRNPKSRIDAVLRLFAKVCDAVHAAHLKGIIHRDLKPSNIRVDANGEPHILDFGLAKVAGATAYGGPSPAAGTDEDQSRRAGTDLQLMTLTGQFLGSLPWSSPEQAEGAPSKIDIRTDVYSLGVNLYQLLTGRFPYEVTGNMRDVLDRIMHVEPTRPSRSTGPPILAASDTEVRRYIDDEVETLILKCLAKERERRYQSAGEIARDIGHYLAGEPIEAKRDSGLYLLRKLLQKHRVSLGVSIGFMCLVLAGTITSVLAWRQAAVAQQKLIAALGRNEKMLRIAEAREREAQSARDAESHAKLVAVGLALDFASVVAYQESMLRDLDDAIAEANLPNVRRMLYEGVFARASTMIDHEFADRPEPAVKLHTAIGSILRKSDMLDAAEPHLRRAVEIRRETPGARPGLAACLTNLGLLTFRMRDHAGAEALFVEAIDQARSGPPESRSEMAGALSGLGQLMQRRGNYRMAEDFYFESLEMLCAARPRDDRAVAAGLIDLGNSLRAQQRYEAAEEHLREALFLLRARFGDSDPAVASALRNYGLLRAAQGDLHEAEAYLREALDLYRKRLGDDHTQVADTLLSLAKMYEIAEPCIRECIVAGRPCRHQCQHEQADAAKAETFLQEALAIYRKTLPNYPIARQAQARLGRVLTSLGRFRDAEQLLLENRELLPLQREPPFPIWRGTVCSLVALYESWRVTEPDGDHGCEAARWREELAALEATSQPAGSSTADSVPWGP